MPNLPNLPNLIDTHCHLTMPDFESDSTDVIKRATETGVTTLITIGTDLDDSRSAIAIAEEHDFIYAGIGVHPHEVKELKDPETTSQTLTFLAKNKKVVAIGETGLDYHYLHSPADMQQEYFRMHIETAITLDLPVIIHSREAKEDTMKILKAHGKGVRGVFHCFSGDMEMMEKVLDMGFYISFSGVITFKKAENILEIIKHVPIDRILVETDAPFLTPQPFRGKRNEPSYVRYTAEKVAEVKGISKEETCVAIMKNAVDLFKISR